MTERWRRVWRAGGRERVERSAGRWRRVGKERERERACTVPGAGTARTYLPTYLHLRSPKVATYVVGS